MIEFIENFIEEEMMIIDNVIDDIMCDDCNFFKMVDDYYLKWVLYWWIKKWNINYNLLFFNSI